MEFVVMTLAVFVKCQSLYLRKNLVTSLSVLWRGSSTTLQAVMLLSKTGIGFLLREIVQMMLFHNYFKSRAVKSLLIVESFKIYLLGI